MNNHLRFMPTVNAGCKKNPPQTAEYCDCDYCVAIRTHVELNIRPTLRFDGNKSENDTGRPAPDFPRSTIAKLNDSAIREKKTEEERKAFDFKTVPVWFERNGEFYTYTWLTEEEADYYVERASPKYLREALERRNEHRRATAEYNISRYDAGGAAHQ